MLCMISPPPPADDPNRIVFSCRGDSGGPLVRNFGRRDELVGVTSWSMGCGHDGFPSVYTDVTKFARWIDAARRQLKSGAAIAVDDPAAPDRRTVRRH
jgi:secreted trypsin-like serine protease